MPAANFQIHAAGKTDAGRRRQHNEDAFACAQDHRLFVVADGMGGHAAGEVASDQAVKSIRAFVEQFDTGDNSFTWPFGVLEGLSPSENLLINAIKVANRNVCKLAQDRAEYSGMGTTVVACRIEGEEAIVGHVGDSRLYLLREGTLRRCTEDHSWVNEQVQQGALNEEEARTHRWRNIITRALGNRFEVDVERQSVGLRAGDIILLCTDGLSGVVEESHISEILSEAGSDVETACERLIAAANEAGGPDNITVVVLHLTPA